MELKRKVYQNLLDWKRKKGRTAMLIEGARRVGKSYIAKKFAENEYQSYILIDFSKADEDIKDLFVYDLMERGCSWKTM
ncbi:AAA family ATPase [[Eubacterium] hominis]|uniref:AAA family ATPase n=1 Tax=[Eubacterium] hominis TaxID=2764325 RepID=UPI003A4D77C7